MPAEPNVPTPALTARTVAHGPSWEHIARPGFASAWLRYELRVRFERDLDWSGVRQELERGYASKDDGYVAKGRTIALASRQLTLGVSGTTGDLPADDEKLQTRLVVLVLEQLRDLVREVGTERWTDTPFEEPPEKVRRGAEGIAYLEQLVLDTFGIQIAEMDYYRPRLWGGDAANPEIRISVEGPRQRAVGARPNWIGQTTFFPPGRYRLTAAAPVFSLPEYRSTLAEFAREPVFVSAPLEIEGAAGEIAKLRVGVPENQRRLPVAHKAFFDQWRAETKAPPPPPLEAIFLEVLPDG